MEPSNANQKPRLPNGRQITLNPELNTVLSRFRSLYSNGTPEDPVSSKKEAFELENTDNITHKYREEVGITGTNLPKNSPTVKSEKKRNEKVPNKRETWNNKVEYFLAAVGYSVSIGNVWRFPYMAMRNGGGTLLFCPPATHHSNV